MCVCDLQIVWRGRKSERESADEKSFQAWEREKERKRERERDGPDMISSGELHTTFSGRTHNPLKNSKWIKMSILSSYR